jgi:hypothetical protein
MTAKVRRESEKERQGERREKITSWRWQFRKFPLRETAKYS